MKRVLFILLVLVLVVLESTAEAQRGGRRGRGRGRGGPVTAEQQPTVQTLSQRVQFQLQDAELGDEQQAEVDRLIESAEGFLESGDEGQARRDLAHAQALIAGQSWEPQDALVWSLDYEPGPAVSDSAESITGEVRQHFQVPEFNNPELLRLNIYLTTRPGQGEEAQTVAQLGEVPFRGTFPWEFNVGAQDVDDGYYRQVTEVKLGDETLVSFDREVAFYEGILSNKDSIEARLEQIEGHESAKASVRWPYDIARVVNEGIRPLGSGEFGLGVDGTRDFKFAEEMQDSEALLTALEAGEDPLTRAKGDHERHYWFEEAGEIMPYRVYVPSTWDGESQLPMVFVLHGNTRDHNFYFDRDDGVLWKEAEEHGYIVATCMGYRPNGGYNSNALSATRPNPDQSADGRGRGRRGGRRGGFGRGGFGRGGGQTVNGFSQSELSEMDAMNAFELIVNEFNPDPERIFLFGHSAGGSGGWYLGEKHIDKWAAIALSAFGTRPYQVDFEKFEGTPLLMICGTEDGAVRRVDEMVEALRETDLEMEYFRPDGATHDNIVGLSLPVAYEFFDKHGGKE